MMHNINDILYTGIGDKSSKRKTFILEDLPEKVAKIEARLANEEDSDDLQWDGMKITISCNNIDFWTRLELLLALKQSGHSDTLTEASYLIDEIYKGGEIKNEQQYRNALDKFIPNKWNFLVKY